MVEEKKQKTSKETKGKLKPQETVGVSGAVKGFYHYLNRAWKKPSKEQIETQRKNMVLYRHANRFVKLEKPSRLDAARRLGYKAKKGFVIIRVRIERGGRARIRPVSRRKPANQRVGLILGMNYQWVAESRAQKKFLNLEVLNSYMVGRDGKYFFYEVIMVDPNRSEIQNDKTINWICSEKNRNRALRGLTSAGKKSRGLRHKSHNLKVRPSRRAWGRRGH